jgi:hypothetical protein
MHVLVGALQASIQALADALFCGVKPLPHGVDSMHEDDDAGQRQGLFHIQARIARQT